ncbi:hypothetical protein HMPREF1544_12322 [Mucor circinelloides 1006PhL]|uniref:Uncharacterized protein n=1 Tax=Mucor circinelloides f. circinelloides (strain 1006PhL) TaxID=1220926 RepID=S2JMI9_MUCC1|nr:hypothetical protein HMPREF1544_12322 [Mucor circinelloides 1006PhL]
MFLNSKQFGKDLVYCLGLIQLALNFTPIDCNIDNVLKVLAEHFAMSVTVLMISYLVGCPKTIDIASISSRLWPILNTYHHHNVAISKATSKNDIDSAAYAELIDHIA